MRIRVLTRLFLLLVLNACSRGAEFYKIKCIYHFDKMAKHEQKNCNFRVTKVEKSPEAPKPPEAAKIPDSTDANSSLLDQDVNKKYAVTREEYYGSAEEYYSLYKSSFGTTN